MKREENNVELKLHTMKCNHCGSEVADNVRYCSTCYRDIGFPNVREAGKHQEREALDERYRKEIQRSNESGSYKSVQGFEEAMKKTFAVINVDLDFLLYLFTNTKALYSSYNIQIRAKIRRPAKPEDDKMRLAVDARLFGNYASEMIYAALSLDGRGVKSWGDYSIKLKEITINHRATLLEDNSFHFFKNHNIGFTQSLPLGYRAIWEERHKLAVAKLAKLISDGTSEQEYAKILLYSDGNRETDDFIEVHIFGIFDINAIESVKGRFLARNRDEKVDLEKIKDYLKNAEIGWIEE